MAYLECKNLKIGYRSPILNEPLNFAIERGDYLTIVGENGAGKSTLMKTILHLTSPIEGEILYGDGLQANEIGYLPQQTVVQKDFPASVREVVLSGCQSLAGKRPFYTKAEKSLARENMEKMGISSLADRSYRDLSGGQQQRVLLARALCATRKVLLMDEPVAGLDPTAMSEMYEQIRSLNEEGVTIIMISHDIQEAIRCATHVLHIGDKIFWGTTKEYLGSEIGKRFTRSEGGED